MTPKLDPLHPPSSTAIDRLREVRWLFFDVGYTLLDETQAWQDQFERLSIETRAIPHGRPIGVEQLWANFLAACESFAPGQWKAVCESVATSPADVHHFMNLGSGWRHDLQSVYPGVGDTLAALASRYKLGVIANQAHGTRERLTKHGLVDHFNVIIGSAEAGVVKPDPKIFQLALAEANCEPADAAMIGDRIDNDVAPAKRLGMLSVHVRQGGSAAQHPRSDIERPTVTVGSVPELEQLLTRMKDGA